MENDLFAQSSPPLAERMRPKSLADYVGQQHILAKDQPLYKSLTNDKLHSMIFWGPPGVGKTTLAKLIAHTTNNRFESISAVLSGVKDIKAVVDKAKMSQTQGHKTLLFVDEVHRFNKAQQDAFLPHVESGLFIFIGATTENPSFELNSALLSRARVYILKSLNQDDIESLMLRALTNDDQLTKLTYDPVAIEKLAQAADGDGRRALNLLEIAASQLSGQQRIDDKAVESVLVSQPKRFDRQGDVFYEQISALHKSVRGSAPDAALYWLCRMLDGGCDPVYIARRLIRMASEEIGNADPKALDLAMNAWDVMTRLGSPEGELTLAQAVLYLASAPKSNAAYNAYNACRAFVSATKDYQVPNHLKNAPTQLMKDSGMSQGYRYAHDEEHAYAAGEQYLPEDIKSERFYQPVDRGLEIKIKQKLEWLASLDNTSNNKRYEE